MINISLPFSVKVGPGFDTFALALNSYVKAKILSVEKNSEEKGIVFETSGKKCVVTEEFFFLCEKVFKFLKKNYNLPDYKIKIQIICDKNYIPFLNQSDTLMLLLIKVMDITYNLNFDDEKILKLFKRMSGQIECGVASYMGSLGVADRDRKNFLTLRWPEDWKIKILQVSNKNKNSAYFNNPQQETISDAISKTAFFTAAVCSKSSELLFPSIQDKINYLYGSANVPFADKINIICRTSRIFGISYLKNDSGFIITGKKSELEDCVERIKALYERNSIINNFYSFDCEQKGINIWEE
ncbi:MAG: hypothetical protein WC002_04630 [Candidatus Muiribacteriota bacterium]|jgi:homoserine kinase